MSEQQHDQPFNVAPVGGRVVGTAVPLMRDYVNTDIIIPATYMRRLTKTGYGDVLFEPWRGTPGFPLEEPRFAGASILLAGEAFGSGSSREHAPWALRDGGFRAVIASSFADIFAQNCANIGLVTARLEATQVHELAGRVNADPQLRITVDVRTLEIKTGDLADGSAENFHAPFELAASSRARLLDGRDGIATTLQFEQDIAAYEARRPPWMPTIKQSRP